MVRHFGAIFTAVMLASSVNGQTSRGTVAGAVTDPSGAAVGGASVEVTQVSTQVRRDASTNAAGLYRFDAVDLGTYELKVRIRDSNRWSRHA